MLLTALSPSGGGSGRSRGVDCLTEPGIVCFPAAPSPWRGPEFQARSGEALRGRRREFRRPDSGQTRTRVSRPSSTSRSDPHTRLPTKPHPRVHRPNSCAPKTPSPPHAHHKPQSAPTMSVPRTRSRRAERWTRSRRSRPVPRCPDGPSPRLRARSSSGTWPRR